MTHTFLILGGYGNAGRLIANLLLGESKSNVIISGRNLNRAESFAEELNKNYLGNRVKAIQVDAQNADQLKLAFRDITMVVAASSTAALTEIVATSAIQSNIDYFDIQFSHEKIRILRTLENKIIRSGLCFITDGGYHPGIPAAMIRYATTRMNLVTEAVVGAIMNINWKAYQFSDETIREFTDELKVGSPLVYKNGLWEKARWGGMFDTLKMNFGASYGKKELFPMFLEEMRELPIKFPTLKKTGFYIGGMDWFSNWISFPLAATWFYVFPRSQATWIRSMIFWGMKKFSKPPYFTCIRMESKGISMGKSMRYDVTLSHADGYMFTAIPVVACLKQYIEGDSKKPGLFTQGEIVEPVQFMHDMKRMGIQVEENLSIQ
jgi:saccharopine dehydrogenase (NAD+, L-lysine-forming)